MDSPAPAAVVVVAGSGALLVDISTEGNRPFSLIEISIRLVAVAGLILNSFKWSLLTVPGPLGLTKTDL